MVLVWVPQHPSQNFCHSSPYLWTLHIPPPTRHAPNHPHPSHEHHGEEREGHEGQSEAEVEPADGGFLHAELARARPRTSHDASFAVRRFGRETPFEPGTSAGQKEAWPSSAQKKGSICPREWLTEESREDPTRSDPGIDPKPAEMLVRGSAPCLGEKRCKAEAPFGRC